MKPNQITLDVSNALEASESFIRNIPDYPSGFKGRGIVTSGGGARYFTNAWVCINMLRKLGCTLPIQVWYLGPKEMDPHMKSLLRDINVEAINAYELREQHPARILNGWELKPYSMIWSPFEEVLFLDADNVPVQNPEFLFDSPQFREHGAVFWPDFNNMEPEREIWDLTGVPYRDEAEFETGQILVDKSRCWRELALTMWYNEHSDFYYHFIHGDKDTFRFGWHKFESKFAMPSRRIHALAHTMCQHDFEGSRLFQHRNMDKWKLDGSNVAIEGFMFEDDCRTFLSELQSRWSGKVGLAPVELPGQYKGVKGKAADELTSTLWDYRRIGHDHRAMSFLPDGRIGIGSKDMEVYWLIREEDGQLKLEIYSEQHLTMVFGLSSDGTWDGQWLYHEQMYIRLVPLKATVVGQNGKLQWNRFAELLITEAEPMSQNVQGKDNLGFGWMYYGLVRNLRPDFVIAIGSARGFMPFSAARGLQDNGMGQLIFIDPSFEGTGDPAWEGRGHWSNPEAVQAWLERFGLSDWVTHIKKTSEEAFPEVQKMTFGGETGLVIIDGAHTFENSLMDFEMYSKLIQSGFALFHDSINANCEVDKTIRVLKSRGYQAVTIQESAGLTLIEVAHPPRVEDKWRHLVQPSNRAEKMKPIVESLVQPGDQVFDAYCGLSPLPPIISAAKIFGFDIDSEIIGKLRETHPQHQWQQISENYLIHADLPDAVQVLAGLGLNYGYAPWDAKLVVPNLRFLVRYYHPRACLFEAAADYHDAEILDELQTMLEKEGYTTETQLIETDLPEYSIRKLLIGRS